MKFITSRGCHNKVSDKVSEIVEQENNAKSQRTWPVVHLTSKKECDFNDVIEGKNRHFSRVSFLLHLLSTDFTFEVQRPEVSEIKTQAE